MFVEDADEGCCASSDYATGPCCLRPPILFTAILFLTAAVFCAYIGVIVTDYRIGEVEDELSRVHVQQFTLDGGMRPQFYTYNTSGEWSVPSGIFMPADGRMYARSLCTFAENTRSAQVRFIVQGSAETTSAQLTNWVEFRFEIPYGLPLGVLPGGETPYSRCPTPQCGTADYRVGIGSSGSFTNAESAFLTIARVTQNRTLIAPVPVTCGCSMEMPVRMSCSFPGSGLYALDGAFEAQGEFWYQTVNNTVPPSA
jgi:hypothetical protein